MGSEHSPSHKLHHGQEKEDVKLPSWVIQSLSQWKRGAFLSIFLHLRLENSGDTLGSHLSLRAWWTRELFAATSRSEQCIVSEHQAVITASFYQWYHQGRQSCRRWTSFAVACPELDSATSLRADGIVSAVIAPKISIETAYFSSLKAGHIHMAFPLTPRQ